jgi:hypothetical protein
MTLPLTYNEITGLKLIHPSLVVNKIRNKENTITPWLALAIEQMIQHNFI